MFDNVFYVEACEQITRGDVGSNIDFPSNLSRLGLGTMILLGEII